MSDTRQAQSRLNHRQERAMEIAIHHDLCGDNIAIHTGKSFARWGRNHSVLEAEANHPERAKRGIRWADTWLRNQRPTAPTPAAPRSARAAEQTGVDAPSKLRKKNEHV
jgi:hypothetical protein